MAEIIMPDIVKAGLIKIDFMTRTKAFYGIFSCHARFGVLFSWRHLSEVLHPESFRDRIYFPLASS